MIIITTKTIIKGNLNENKPKLISTGLVFKTTNITANKIKINPAIKYTCPLFLIFDFITLYFLDANANDSASPIDGKILYNLAAKAKLMGKLSSLLLLPK